MDHQMFNDQLEVLQDYFVIAWDARGHGESRPVKGTFGIKELAANALAILDALDVEQAVFIGQSEGSMISQEVYRQRPSAVKALVSIGGSPIMIPYGAYNIWLLKSTIPIIKLWPYKNFMRALAKKTAITKEAQDYALQTVSKISKKDFLSIWDGVTNSLSAHGIKDMRISVPLLITYGEHDHTGEVQENNKKWAAYEPHAKLVVIPDAGHNANQDNPVFVNKLLGTFLKESL